MSIRQYLETQRCFTQPLAVNVWHSVKIKASSAKMSKGHMPEGLKGGLLLFVNEKKVCTIAGEHYCTLPASSNSYAYFGSLPAPFTDTHLTANATIRDVKYAKPASNFFVGVVNSIQGALSVVVMYPIGWIGDKLNRYTLLRVNVMVGMIAASCMGAAVVRSSLFFMYTGIVIFTFYQQCLSAMIYTVLADNVERPGRTKASANYKTFSALAMAFAPAIQYVVLLAGPVEDQWTSGTFDSLILPGWLILPVVALSIFNLRPVGEKISDIPNVDEVSQRLPSAANLDEA